MQFRPRRELVEKKCLFPLIGRGLSVHARTNFVQADDVYSAVHDNKTE